MKRRRSSKNSPNNDLRGVRRYRKGRTICDTLFGRARYGKDQLTGDWVIIKESKRWHVENRVSIRGMQVAEDLGTEIAVHQEFMAFPDVSPNIVRLIDVCEDPNYIYVITEFCRGGDLFAFVHNSHPLYKQRVSGAEIQPNEKRVWFSIIRGLFRQCISCIAWMHSKRYCHRDLSLENILLTDQGVAKIIDFGVTLKYDSEDFQTPAGFVGKQGYCSPEVYGLQEYDGRKADIWSLGVILFVLLTGAPPYAIPLNSDSGFRIIMEGKLADLLEAWKRPIEPDSQDLLMRIFRLENERLPMHEILTHSYALEPTEPSLAPETMDSNV